MLVYAQYLLHQLYYNDCFMSLVRGHLGARDPESDVLYLYNEHFGEVDMAVHAAAVFAFQSYVEEGQSLARVLASLFVTARSTSPNWISPNRQRVRTASIDDTLRPLPAGLDLPRGFRSLWKTRTATP